MLTALYVTLLVSVVGCAILVAIFGAEVLMGCATVRQAAREPHVVFGGKICVLVPAHNEEAGIASTLRNIRAQLRPSDRIVVVADNCSDNTAAVAASEAAEVFVRHDTDRRGKGYALDWGMQQLAGAPPDVVVIVDADCRLADRAIERLATAAFERNRPVQALYLMTGSASSSVGQKVSAFAWLLKNHLRPLGLSRVNLPCQLMGTGMAFPWPLLRKADLANGDLVEDMRLGLELASAGSAPLFLPQAIVSSTFPTTDAGSLAQRKRWEQGHLRMIATMALPFFGKGVARGNWPLAALCLDLMIPPVSLFVLIVAALFVMSAAAALGGLPATALVLSTLSIAVMVVSITTAWFVIGRAVLPRASLLGIPAYVGRKIPIYTRLVAGRGSKDWVRSDRT